MPEALTSQPGRAFPARPRSGGAPLWQRTRSRNWCRWSVP